MFSTRIATQIYAKICFETTSGQKKIIEKLSEYLADDDFSRIFVLNGYAGTGKTTLIAALVGALKDLNIKPVLLAPTGRAAKVLAQYAQEKALTIHKRIYRQRTNADYESKYSLNINTEKGAVFIVDEASMLSDGPGDGALFGSGSLLEDLVQYVRSGRACRLILVGDSAQLPPVGADCSPALDPSVLARFGDVEYGTMDEVVRQEAESGILFNATLVRCMLENGIYEIPHFETDYPDIEAVEGGEFLDKLQDCYAKYGRDETIVITRSNKRANRYNEGIRRNVTFAEEEIESNDMLMVVKNNYYFTERNKDCPCTSLPTATSRGSSGCGATRISTASALRTSCSNSPITRMPSWSARSCSTPSLRNPRRSRARSPRVFSTRSRRITSTSKASSNASRRYVRIRTSTPFR